VTRYGLEIDRCHTLAPPSSQHWFTDGLGRDCCRAPWPGALGADRNSHLHAIALVEDGHRRHGFYRAFGNCSRASTSAVLQDARSWLS
jgi:hypothetical protein